MVLLNISTFYFSSPKILFLAPLKFSIYKTNPYFLVNSCLTFIFFNKTFQKWAQNYDNIFQIFLEFINKT